MLTLLILGTTLIKKLLEKYIIKRNSGRMVPTLPPNSLPQKHLSVSSSLLYLHSDLYWAQLSYGFE